jgi:DNA primase small subunit
LTDNKKEDQAKLLVNILQEYYKNNAEKVYMPEEFENREFGFSFFDGKFKRHISFHSFDDYKTFLIENVPKDVYYSIALYRNPSIDMQNKGWLGAELPFDLDAEQVLRTSDELLKRGWISSSQYQRIKELAINLIENFLEADFGLKSDDYLVSFSGSRGYHIRIKEKTYLGLDQKARRQIVEYVAIGPSINFPTHQSRFLPFAHDYGWNRKIFLWLKHIDSTAFSADEVALKILAKIKKLNKPSELVITNVERRAFENMFTKALSELTISIDERVTVDVNRLLRAPMTVHGGSGFLVKPLSKSSLEKFDPFVHASMPLNSYRRIIVKEIPFEVSINNETVSPSDQGKTIEVNSALAYYLVIRGGGNILE